MSKELNSVYEQVAQCCVGLDLEGRAIILGVSGLDAGANASFAKGLKAHLAAAGNEVSVFHLEDFADAAARQEILASKSGTPDLCRYCEEGIDYALARQSIYESNAENGVLIVEGCLLYTGALSDLFDLRIFLDVDPATARAHLESAKATAGDAKVLQHFDTLLQPAFELYLLEYDPVSAADLALDFNDARKPRAISAVG